MLGDPDQPSGPAGGPGEPVRIGDGVPPPAKIHDVPPVYFPPRPWDPPKPAFIHGLVVSSREATIDPAGEVGDPHRGIAFRARARRGGDLFRRGRAVAGYEPTLVDGAPVSVTLMTVDHQLPAG